MSSTVDLPILFPEVSHSNTTLVLTLITVIRTQNLNLNLIDVIMLTSEMLVMRALRTLLAIHTALNSQIKSLKPRVIFTIVIFTSYSRPIHDRPTSLEGSSHLNPHYADHTLRVGSILLPFGLATRFLLSISWLPFPERGNVWKLPLLIPTRNRWT